MLDHGPCFNRAVTHNGYAWWYVDALSDDGRTGITLIAFIGSVFSPYYAFARRSRTIDPLNHCALNVAIYGDGFKRWTMTERRAAAVTRTRDSFAIGPSRLAWDGGALTITINEVGNPLPARVRGSVRVYPAAITTAAFALDDERAHTWRPIAPCARVEVELAHPAMRWSGQGYFDINSGTRPLERDFSGWEWSRASLGADTVVSYDTALRRGAAVNLALRFRPDGSVEPITPLASSPLPRTGWRIARTARADSGDVRVSRTLEDTPFYARSQLTGRVLGQRTDIMHESLSLDRFRMPIVQTMLPFRMPRW